MTALAYLDVGASRIQTWLARTQLLRLRRGASALLADVTDPGRVLDALGNPVEVSVNQAAAPVSGVVHLVVAGDDADSAVDRAADHARALLTWLRAEVPGLTWEARWTRAGSYADARARADAGHADGVLRGLPATGDVPVLRRCDTCAQAIVVARVDLPDKPGVRVCADCQARLDKAGYAGDGGRLPQVAVDLLARLADAHPGIAADGFPSDLEALAVLGGDTQTALVFADGNRIGDYMKAAAAQERAAAAGAAITEATWQALVTAVGAITAPGASRWPIVPHLVGGDDVLVSVPANGAWTFTRTLLAAFEQELAGGGGGPTMSAGIVIGHHSQPFLAQVEQAESLLNDAAKVDGRGRGAIAWVDTTADERSIGVRVRGDSLTLAQLNTLAPDLSALASWPRSQRQALAAVADPAGHADRGGAGRGDVVRRLDHEIGLGQALVLTRWWA